MPFCKQCGEEISQDTRFCPHCGTEQISYVTPPPSQAGLETKNTGLTALIALILGIFGIWGAGHIYVGKLTRGIVLIILGILIEWVLGFVLIFGALSMGAHWLWEPRGAVGALIGAVILWLVITIGIFIWQIYDAYNLAKYYNQYVQQYRKPPW